MSSSENYSSYNYYSSSAYPFSISPLQSEAKYPSPLRSPSPPIESSSSKDSSNNTFSSSPQFNPLQTFPSHALKCRWNSCLNANPVVLRENNPLSGGINILVDPICLPCGHNFCKNCIQALQGKCTVCSRNFDGHLELFETNLDLQTICLWFSKLKRNTDLQRPNSPLLMGSHSITVDFKENHLSHRTSVNIEWTVQELISRLVKKFPTKENIQYGLFVPSRSKWMDERKRLSDYEEDIQDPKITIHLKKVSNLSKKTSNLY